MLYRKTFYALVAAATVIVDGNGIVLAKKRPACSAAGRFIATKSPLVASQVDAARLFSVTIATVSATSITLAIPGCSPATAKLKSGGTAIKAKWTSCAGLTGKVQLMGTVAKGCKQIKGTLSQSKGKPHRRRAGAHHRHRPRHLRWRNGHGRRLPHRHCRLHPKPHDLVHRSEDGHGRGHPHPRLELRNVGLLGRRRRRDRDRHRFPRAPGDPLGVEWLHPH